MIVWVNGVKITIGEVKCDIKNYNVIAERLSARLLILQCVFSVGGVWL